MAIYGDMLMWFPELQETFPCFTAEVKVGSGIGERHYLDSVRGILQYLKGGGVDKETGAVYSYERPFLWTRRELPMLCFIVKGNGIYRIIGNNDWSREGGFHRYDLEEWQGILDTQKTDASIDFTKGF